MTGDLEAVAAGLDDLDDTPPFPIPDQGFDSGWDGDVELLGIPPCSPPTRPPRGARRGPSPIVSLVQPLPLGPAAGADAGRLQALERILLVDRVSDDELTELLALRKEWLEAGFAPRDLHGHLIVHRALLALGKALKKARVAYGNGDNVNPDSDNSRDGAILALLATAKFINAFPPFREEDLAQPLQDLGTKLYDLDRGGAPPAILTPVKVSNRPKWSWPEGILALGAAIALEAARKTHVPDPAKTVADLLNGRGYKASGKEITATTVNGWRNRLNRGPEKGRVDEWFCDRWDEAKRQMTRDPSFAARGPRWFVDQLPPPSRDADADFAETPRLNVRPSSPSSP